MTWKKGRRFKASLLTVLSGGARDTTAPTVTLSSSALQLVNAAFTVTATLSETVTDFVDGSVTVSNGTASVAGSGLTRTITITPTADGTVTVDILANAIHDAAGNGNTASNQISRIYLSTMTIWVKSDSGTWKDAAKSVAATADGDVVYTWANLVTGNDFVQATEANRPLLKIVAGAHFIRFDGSNDWMSTTISADASCTLFFIAKKNTAPVAGSDAFFGFDSGTALIFANTAVGTGFNYWNNQAGAGVSLGGTVTNLSAVSIVYTDATSASARIDGGAPTAFDPNNVYSTKTTIVIGAQDIAGGNAGDDDFMEVIYCTSPLADAARAAVEAYLATRVANPT